MYHSAIGQVQQDNGEVCIVTSVGEAGCVVYGPYCVLGPGSYEVEFRVLPHDLNDQTCCVADVLRRGSGLTAEKDFTASELIHRNGIIKIRFEVVRQDTYEFRVFASGRSALTVRYRRPLRQIDSPPVEA